MYAITDVNKQVLRYAHHEVWLRSQALLLLRLLRRCLAAPLSVQSWVVLCVATRNVYTRVKRKMFNIFHTLSTVSVSHHRQKSAAHSLSQASQ